MIHRLGRLARPVALPAALAGCEPPVDERRLRVARDRRPRQTIIRSHPEWTQELVALGAREIVFAAGFPDGIEIDAKTWLDHGRDLLAAAPIRRVKIRNAQGRTAAVVRSPLLATIEGLDLDGQGVTDEDLHGLAGSPHASRLERLDLRFNPITEVGIEFLAASPHPTRLEAKYGRLRWLHRS